MTPYYQVPPHFVHLGFNPGRVLSLNVNKQIENYLDSVADDWYRYAAQNYVVWTNKDVTSLSKELTQQAGLESLYVLATEFSRAPAHCNGMMPKKFWDWLNKPR